MKYFLVLFLLSSLVMAQPTANGKFIGMSSDGKYSIIEHTVEAGATTHASVCALYRRLGLIFQPHQVARRNGYKNNEELAPIGVRIFLYTEQALPSGFPTNNKWQDYDIILHELKEGETLYQIKKQYIFDGNNITLDSLISWNDLKDADDVDLGQFIIFLKRKVKPKPYNFIGKDKDWNAIEYTVQPDMPNLDKIAEYFVNQGIEITGKELRRWNGYYESEDTEEGIRIFLFTKKDLPANFPKMEKYPNKKLVIHEIVDGETLYSIRRKYYGERPEVSLNEIVEWNDLLGTNDIAIGQFLILFVKK
jgi:LysM repeat protein